MRHVLVILLAFALLHGPKGDGPKGKEGPQGRDKTCEQTVCD